jgi:Predicted nucleoside-diphosphate sugar epimerases
MTRFFMTIPEASRLVIQAGALGVNGAVYVLDMGAPVKLADLARDMIRLAGADDDDIQIVFTGLRPGEKLHEELFTESERLGATRFEQIMVAHHEETIDLVFPASVDTLVCAAETRDWEELRRSLKTLMPDYDAADVAGQRPWWR